MSTPHLYLHDSAARAVEAVAAIRYPDTTTQTARHGRREPLLHLLSRMQRGVLLPAERPLLRAAVETELADGDRTQGLVALTETLAASAGRNAETYARRFEKAVDRLRKARAQRDAAISRAQHAECELAAARAENDGLAETMRNTDRLTTQQLAEERARADNLGEQFRDRRHALSQALSLGTSAPWDAITERARAVNAHRTELIEQRGEAWGRQLSTHDLDICNSNRERTRRSLAEARRLRDEACGQLDAQQLAVSDALGLEQSVSWEAITDRARELADDDATHTTCVRHLGEATASLADLRNDLYAERRAHEEHRRELATILNAGCETAWSALLGQVAARNADWARCADEGERNAAADVAAALQAEEQAGRALTLRHGQLAHALGHGTDTSWPDLINTARLAHTRFAEALRRGEADALRAARQSEAEAVRARQAAETAVDEWRTTAYQVMRQRDAHAAELREAERQLGEARRQAEVWRVDAATQGQIVKQRTEERDQLADHDQPAEPERRPNCRCDLTEAVAPVSPRKVGNAMKGHPVYELIECLTRRGALTDPAARDLIGRYYSAITSAPPADPAERPIKVTVRAELTPEQVAKAVRKATRIAGRSGR